jgi:hypothetical protein
MSTSDILTNGPKPSDEFLAAVEAARSLANDLRAAMLAVVRASPKDDRAVWIATMTTLAVPEALAEIGLLCDTSSQSAKESGATIANALAGVAPPESVEAFAHGLVRGMTAAAMSCECGTCNFCDARRVDPAGAERTIERDMARAIGLPPPRPRIHLVKG